MYRFFFRVFVITVTILTANLITTALSDYMITYKNHVKPIIFTFMGMTIIVVVFYPLFLKMEDWVRRFSIKFVKSGKGVAGKFLGIFLTFIAAMLILFYFYAKMWYNIDFMKVLLNGDIARYF